jgi:hypothetical protein
MNLWWIVHHQENWVLLSRLSANIPHTSTLPHAITMTTEVNNQISIMLHIYMTLQISLLNHNICIRWVILALSLQDNFLSVFRTIWENLAYVNFFWKQSLASATSDINSLPMWINGKIILLLLHQKVRLLWRTFWISDDKLSFHLHLGYPSIFPTRSE